LSHDWIPDLNFFKQLDDEDERITAEVRSGGCPACGGRLDRADYPRKPRGGDLGAAGEIFDRRRSLCCAAEGCRRRRTPRSLVFLGRRVYLAITVVLAAWQTTIAWSSPPRRTVARWRGWFSALRGSSWWTETRVRLSPAVEPAEILPAAIIERVHRGRPIDAALIAAVRLLPSAA
jgi:hypothetical protein